VDLVNDISALRFDPDMARVVARWQAGIVLMHCRGTPATMHQLPPSPNIFSEIRRDLQVALENAQEAGIRADGIILDPGLGFGKNTEENLRILNDLDFLEDFQLPVLVGPSRKRFLGEILETPVDKRLMGTAAVCAAAVLKGAHILRIHDVREIRQITKVVDSILSETLVQ
jgi:dihydropteroate synthase